jgi:Skp family chaperone for outer membrane proteins
MKNLFPSALLALCLFAGGSSGRAADFKIATVDLRKAFDSYYKTIAASIANSNSVVERDKELNTMIAEERKREDDYHRAVDEANNMSVTADARAQSKKDADQIAVALQIQSETISNFYARTELKIRDDMVQHVTTLTAEIRHVMEIMAKKQGYTMVLDRTALTMTGNPLVLYTSGENDLTDALIKELNSTAPPPTAPETRSPVDSSHLLQFPSGTNAATRPASNAPPSPGPSLLPPPAPPPRR